MKKISEFLKTNKFAIQWTLWYIVGTYLVLRLIFGFSIFSATQWKILFSAQLTGFAGFVFGLLILAAIPLYVATTSIIVRTGKPLFEFKSKKDDKKSDKSEKKKEAPATESKPLPTNIPTELVGPFMRARNNIKPRTESAFDMKDSVATEQKIETPVTPDGLSDGILPLPDDFDFGTPDSDVAPVNTSPPVFKEISFGDPIKKSENTPEQKQESETQGNVLQNYLKSRGQNFDVDGDITITNKMAIAIHDDPDFWIADEENWFASGKQKTSPILMAKSAAKKYGVTPALYLAHKNIMDLDNQIELWKSAGITLITDPDQI
ncbi:hypothetical protein LJC18_04140 [Lachnospiraceae bacterium OttesenSCG-928-E19]|nr:hypothetical protein [Lachnospiraceae bacterium OttesenSCG-928-E19]